MKPDIEADDTDTRAYCEEEQQIQTNTNTGKKLAQQALEMLKIQKGKH